MVWKRKLSGNQSCPVNVRQAKTIAKSTLGKSSAAGANRFEDGDVVANVLVFNERKRNIGVSPNGRACGAKVIKGQAEDGDDGDASVEYVGSVLEATTKLVKSKASARSESSNITKAIKRTVKIKVIADLKWCTTRFPSLWSY